MRRVVPFVPLTTNVPGQNAYTPEGVGDTEPVKPFMCVELFSVPLQCIKSVELKFDHPPSSSHRCHLPAVSSTGPLGSNTSGPPIGWNCGQN